MEAFGVTILERHYEHFSLPSPAGFNNPETYTIEADASSASYFLAAGAIAGGLLTDEQRRRQATYRRVLRKAGNEGDLIVRPTLFAWTAPVDMRFQLPEDMRQVGAALWAIPLLRGEPTI